MESDRRLGGTSWTEVGHRLGPILRHALAEGHMFLIVSGADERYVQLHAHPDGGCYVEADSGAYWGRLRSEQHRVLRDLGWLAPRLPAPSNYSLDLEAPVDVYRLVVLIAATLADAYGTMPEETTYSLVPCACEED